VIRGPAIVTRRSTPPPRHALNIPLRLHPRLASNAICPTPSVPSHRKKEKRHAGCDRKRRDHVEIRTHRLSRPLPVAGVAVTHPTAAQPDEPTAASGGKSCDPPSCRAEACGRSQRSCGETVRHHSHANASVNSGLTPSVTVFNSPGTPSSLPRHMASAEWRRPDKPGTDRFKLDAWQISANQCSTMSVTQSVTNPDPCHGTGLTAGNLPDGRPEDAAVRESWRALLRVGSKSGEHSSEGSK